MEPERRCWRETALSGRARRARLAPSVGVFLEVGLKGHFWQNILLTLLGFIPGIIHARYVILKH